MTTTENIDLSALEQELRAATILVRAQLARRLEAISTLIDAYGIYAEEPEPPRAVEPSKKKHGPKPGAAKREAEIAHSEVMPYVIEAISKGNTSRRLIHRYIVGFPHFKKLSVHALGNHLNKAVEAKEIRRPQKGTYARKM